MIRLQPSEISLTPSDVRAYQRRREMLNRPVRSPPHPQSINRSEVRLRPSGIARIRRGPERSRDDAITYIHRPEEFRIASVATSHSAEILEGSDDVYLDQDVLTDSRSRKLPNTQPESESGSSCSDDIGYDGTRSTAHWTDATSRGHHHSSRSTQVSGSIPGLNVTIEDPIPRFADLTLQSLSDHDYGEPKTLAPRAYSESSPSSSSTIHRPSGSFRLRSWSDSADASPFPAVGQIVRRRAQRAREHDMTETRGPGTDPYVRIMSGSLSRCRRSSLPDIYSDAQPPLEDHPTPPQSSHRMVTSPAALEALRNSPSPLDELARDASSRIPRARSLRQAFESDRADNAFYFPSFQGSALSSSPAQAPSPWTLTRDTFAQPMQQLRHRRGNLVFRTEQDLVPEFAIARGGRPRTSFPFNRQAGPPNRPRHSSADQENTEDMDQFFEERRLHLQRNNQSSSGGVLERTPPRDTFAERFL